jgi:hypothetical protein
MEITLTTGILLIISGIMVGFINTLAGGGTVISISLFMFLGLPPVVANGTNRIPIIFQTLTAVILYQRKKLIDWKKGIILSIPIILGNLTGAFLAGILPGKIFSYIFAGIVLLFGVSMIFDPNRWIHENKELQIKPVTILQYITFFFLGIYGGFAHVGIGYMYLGMLVLVSGYDLLKANVLKIVFVMMSVPFSLAIFASQGHVDWGAGLIHAIGNIIGAAIGVRFAIKKNINFIRYIVLSLVALVILQLLGIVTPEKILGISKLAN